METKHVTVLIVDDDPNIRELCADVLTDEGYDVTTASNGQEALQRIEKNGISVALVDMMMPVMDGLQLCRILRSQERTRNLPIIIMSAATNLARRIGDQLADGVLVKPFEIDKLISCVAELTATA